MCTLETPFSSCNKILFRVDNLLSLSLVLLGLQGIRSVFCYYHYLLCLVNRSSFKLIDRVKKFALHSVGICE